VADTSLSGIGELKVRARIRAKDRLGQVRLAAAHKLIEELRRGAGDWRRAVKTDARAWADGWPAHGLVREAIHGPWFIFQDA
jgi:hypothetical protein